MDFKILGLDSYVERAPNEGGLQNSWGRGGNFLFKFVENHNVPLESPERRNAVQRQTKEMQTECKKPADKKRISKDIQRRPTNHRGIDVNRILVNANSRVTAIECPAGRQYVCKISLS